MQLTIDSAEPLDQVLAVISAVYQVPVVASSTTAPVASQPARSAAKRTTRPRKTAATRTAKIDPSTVRAWARDHGITVNRRGQLPEAVVKAYQTANGG